LIRTLLERISVRESTTKNRMLKKKKKVESDEFYMHAGLKGKLYHEEIILLAREPRKRALKA
jgi:hypothetical protein